MWAARLDLGTRCTQPAARSSRAGCLSRVVAGAPAAAAALFIYLNVVADESRLALKGARQRALRQLEAERKLVQAPRKDGNGAFWLVCNATSH